VHFYRWKILQGTFSGALAKQAENMGDNNVLRLIQTLAPAVSYKESNLEMNRKVWNMYAKVRESEKKTQTTRASFERHFSPHVWCSSCMHLAEACPFLIQAYTWHRILHPEEDDVW
jgi:hypothetical protein